MASTSGEELKQPKPIKFDAVVTDVCFHPMQDIIASGDIDGLVRLHSYSIGNENHELMTFKDHKKSCRAIRFIPDGSGLISASKDKSVRIFDLDNGKVKFAIKKAHDSAIYSLLVIDRNFFATGDDDGNLAVWDLRHRAAVMKLHENQDSITDMIVNSTKTVLLATSGEGTLTAFDIRKHQVKLQSELMDSGLMSIAAVKNDTKVVCGTEDGILDFFNWNEWGNISDRFPGHKMSIDAIVPLSDQIVATADSEAIRAVHLFPNRFLGVIGDHNGFPVERMTISRCKTWLASCSHDNQIKFWNVSEVAKQKVDGHKKADRKNVSKPCAADSEFFKDLVDENTKEAGGDLDAESKSSDAEDNLSTTSDATDSDSTEEDDDDDDPQNN